MLIYINEVNGVLNTFIRVIYIYLYLYIGIYIYEAMEIPIQKLTCDRQTPNRLQDLKSCRIVVVVYSFALLQILTSIYKIY